MKEFGYKNNPHKKDQGLTAEAGKVDCNLRLPLKKIKTILLEA